MLSVFITLLLALHLLCVNIAAGGPLIGAWLDWRGTKSDDVSARAAVFLGKASVHALVAGALLGVLMGWLKWDEHYSAIWVGPLSYKLRWAIFEAIFSLVLMLVWWRWLPGKAGGGRIAMSVRGFLAILAATNLLYHFPVLFSIAGRLERGEVASLGTIRGAAFRALMRSAETPALAVHVTLASVAVAGVLLLWYAKRTLTEDAVQQNAILARAAAWWALLPSLLQLPVGLWVLMSLPTEIQSQMMGQNTLGTLLLVGSLAAALWLVNDLVQIALGEPTRTLTKRASAALVLTVFLMTAMQQHSRLLTHPTASAARGRP